MGEYRLVLDCNAGDVLLLLLLLLLVF